MSEFITLVEREETPLWVVLAIQGFSDRDAFERATDEGPELLVDLPGMLEP